MSLDLMHNLAQASTPTFVRGLELGIRLAQASKEGIDVSQNMDNANGLFGTLDPIEACESTSVKHLLEDAIPEERNLIASYMGMVVGFSEAGGQL